jgi:citrate synthase
LFLTHAGVDAQQFVDDMRKQNKLIMGILGHRIKSLSNPDKRVEKSSSNMLFHTFPTISSVLLQSSK